jgi:hypothetical protein
MIRASTNSDEIIIWARMPTSSSRYFMRAHIIPRNESHTAVYAYPTGLHLTLRVHARTYHELRLYGPYTTRVLDHLSLNFGRTTPHHATGAVYLLWTEYKPKVT